MGFMLDNIDKFIDKPKKSNLSTYNSIPKSNSALGAENSYNAIKNNKAVRDAAVRFAKDRNSYEEIDEDDAIENFISHFRSFNVNELTAGADWNYVSAASADSIEDDNAKKRLEDYAFLYNTFTELPDFYEEGGADGAFLDYFKGIVTAPSTVAGLFLPGVGKVAGQGATQAAKLAVHKTLLEAIKQGGIKEAAKNITKGGVFTKSLAELGRRPILASSIIEGNAAVAQNVARQKVEQKIGVRKESEGIFDLNYLEAGGAGAIGVASNAAIALATAKAITGDAIGYFGKNNKYKLNSLLKETQKAEGKLNKKGSIAADKIIQSNSILAARVAKTLNPLDPKQVADGKIKFDDLSNSMGINVPEKIKQVKEHNSLLNKEVDENTIPDFSIGFDPNRTKRVFGAVVEIVSNSKSGSDDLIKRLNDGERITQAVSRVIREKADDAQELDFIADIYQKYNINGDDFANLFMANMSDAAKTLKSGGDVVKMIREISDSSTDVFGMGREAKEAIKKIGELAEKGDARELLNVTGQGRQSFVRQLDQLRLSFMTSQVATTYRNTISGYTRVGFDFATKLLDRSIATFIKGVDYTTGTKMAAGKTGLLDYKPNDDMFAMVFGLANRTEINAIDSVFKLNFAKKAQSLYRELRDIENASGKDAGKLTTMRAIGKEMNALNTISDNFFKRTAFVSSLKRQLNQMYSTRLTAKNYTDLTSLRKEHDIIDIIKEGRFNQTFNSKEGKNALNNAIEEALYFTYQKSPDGPTAKLMINLAQKAPFLTTSFMPFPRFIANAMRFTYEYSPAYIFQGSYRSFVKPGAEGYEEVAKSLVGLGAFAGAVAYRDSEYSGDNWWEGKTAEGKSYDLRPFFPAAPYLYFADLYLRMKNGDPVLKERGKDFVKESAQALTGTQMRAGMGLWAFDSALSDFENGSLEGLYALGGKGAANIVNTFTIPLTFSQDVFNTFLAPDEYRIVKQSRSTDLLSTIINRSVARIPGNVYFEKILAESLGTKVSEPLESAFQSEKIRRTTPITRQTYGILLKEKRPFIEKEMLRLKMNLNILKSRSGVPEADQLYNKFMGEFSSQYLSPVLENDEIYQEYKKQKNTAGQKNRIREILDRHKSQVREDAVSFTNKKIKGKYDLRKIDNINNEPLTEGIKRYGFNPMDKVKFEKMDRLDRERAIKLYEQNHGKPTRKAPYNYSALIFYAKQFKGRDEVNEFISLNPNAFNN